MPAKLDRCVADVEKQGGIDNPWAICNASLDGKEIEEAIMKEVIETKLKGCGCQKKTHS